MTIVLIFLFKHYLFAQLSVFSFHFSPQKYLLLVFVGVSYHIPSPCVWVRSSHLKRQSLSCMPKQVESILLATVVIPGMVESLKAFAGRKYQLLSFWREHPKYINPKTICCGHLILKGEMRAETNTVERKSERGGRPKVARTLAWMELFPKSFSLSEYQVKWAIKFPSFP